MDIKMKKIFLLAFQIITASLFAQSNVNPKVLNLNDISDNKSPGFEAIYQKARKARVIFAGENHSQIEFNARTEYMLMRSLYENCGYRNFIIEMSPVRSYYMERYIRYNDTHARDLLKSVASDKFLTLFDHLNAWMKNVPQNERIHVHGLDIERFYDMSFYRMNDALKLQKTVPNKKIYLLAKQIIPQIVKQTYHSGLSDYTDATFATVDFDLGDVSTSDYNIVKVIDSITAHIEYFKQWMSPEDFEIFKEGYSGALEFRKWTNTEESAHQYIWREEQMFKNFVKVLSADTTQKFFGQFGRCHSALSKQFGDCGWYNYRSVCNKVKSRYFNGDSTKVVSIAISYRDNEDNLAAVELNDNYTISAELEQIKKVKSKWPLLFDLSDSTGDYTELRKKFNFVLLNSDNVLELPSLDSTGLVLLEASEEESDKFSLWSQIDRKDFNFNLFGLSYGIPNLSMMSNHLSSLNTNISNLPNWYINHHVEHNNRWFICQANIFYNINSAEIQSDSAKKLNYNLFGATFGMGVRAVNTRKLKLDFFGIGGYYYQSIENFPESADILNANTKRVKIESQSMVYGGQIQLIYNFSKYVGIGAKYQILYRSNDEKWNFNQSHIEYQNFGKSSDAVFKDYGVFVNFRSSIYH